MKRKFSMISQTKSENVSNHIPNEKPKYTSRHYSYNRHIPGMGSVYTDIGHLDYIQLASDLYNNGFVVFRVMTDKEVYDTQNDLSQDIKDFPDMNGDGGLEGCTDKTPLVGGAYSMMANPASFHCHTPRRIRAQTYPHFVKLMVCLWGMINQEYNKDRSRSVPSMKVDNQFMRILPDRLVVRPKDKKISEEDPFRQMQVDEYYMVDRTQLFTLREYFQTFHGWVSLSTTSLPLVCKKGSHDKSPKTKHQHIKKNMRSNLHDDDILWFQGEIDQWEEVCVPPGYAVVYYADILKKVRKTIQRNQVLQLNHTIQIALADPNSKMRNRLHHKNKEMQVVLDHLFLPTDTLTGKLPVMWPKMWYRHADRLERFIENRSHENVNLERVHNIKLKDLPDCKYNPYSTLESSMYLFRSVPDIFATPPPENSSTTLSSTEIKQE